MMSKRCSTCHYHKDRWETEAGRNRKLLLEAQQLREENEKLELMWQNASHGQALGVHKIAKLRDTWQEVKKETAVVRSKYPGETWHELTPYHVELLDVALAEVE